MVDLSPPEPGPRRVVLEFHAGGCDRVSGVLRVVQEGAAQPFDGWLDLMRLLEAAVGGSRDRWSPEEWR